MIIAKAGCPNLQNEARAAGDRKADPHPHE